jgi:Low molecular weight phosphotyrosine protein phosphatase
LRARLLQLVDEAIMGVTAGRPSNRPFHVLFLCTHNSAQSILAECIMNRLGTGTFKAYSVGSQPSGRVHPYALELLRELNYDIASLRSKILGGVRRDGCSRARFRIHGL